MINIKKLIFILALGLVLVLPQTVSAQMMGRWPTVADDHTEKEEQEGKQVWDKLQSKKINCQSLTDDQFEVLGEYFMGKMAGDSHAIMNQMMTRMMGEKGEREMHLVMGKRMSGCNARAAYPTGSWGMMPMMGMMGSWWAGSWFFGWWWLIVQLLILMILVLLVIYLWKKLKIKS